MTPNLVSCYCPTYGRVHCLEESVECFLRQDYKGPKELVILNDYEHQNIFFDHPEVKVFNLPYRIEPLGAKFNSTIALCSGDVLMCWEDDDIYLPNRISYTLEHMQDGVFHTGNAFYESQAETVTEATNIFHATHAFTKELFDAIGGYPVKDQCSIDVELMYRISAKLGRAYSVPVDLADRFYIYRWGTIGSYHGSGWGPSNVNVSKSVEDIVEGQRATAKIPSGNVILKPKWSYDYIKAVKR
jgi:glycosyltransferase involved in cell wall biosynthesis